MNKFEVNLNEYMKVKNVDSKYLVQMYNGKEKRRQGVFGKIYFRVVCLQIISNKILKINNKC